MVQDTILARDFETWFRTSDRSQALKWLDVCCGTGDYLKTFHDIVPDAMERARVHYTGFDLYALFLTECKRTLEQVQLSGDTICGQLNHFALLTDPGTYEFVSMINALHEIPSLIIPSLIIEMIERLSKTGFLLIFDLAALKYGEPELGSTPWTKEDAQAFFEWLVRALGGRRQNVYRHRNSAWYTVLHRQDLPDLDLANWSDLREQVIVRAKIELLRIFAERKTTLHKTIKDLGQSLYDAQGWADRLDPMTKATELGHLQQGIDESLRDFWAFGAALTSLEGRS
jgi:ubiquinone/menaquinone biosynthesis C-methylase UbiE